MIKQRREALGLSQQAVADQMGIHQTTVDKHEKSATLKLSTLARFEQVLKIDRRGDWLRRAGFIDPIETARDAIETDSSLDERARAAILDVYDAAVMQTAARRTAESSD